MGSHHKFTPISCSMHPTYNTISQLQRMGVIRDVDDASIRLSKFYLWDMLMYQMESGIETILLVLLVLKLSEKICKNPPKIKTLFML